MRRKKRSLKDRVVTVVYGSTCLRATVYLIRTEYIVVEVSGPPYDAAKRFYFKDEGVTWARGVVSRASNALRAAVALRQV